MTTTHEQYDPSSTTADASQIEPLPQVDPPEVGSESKAADDDASSLDSSFSDAYREEPGQEKKDAVVQQESGSEVDDDYAMTFDSEEEGQSEYHDISESHVEQATPSLPVTVPADVPSPSVSHDSSTSEAPLNGQESKPTQSNPSPSHATPASVAATPAEEPSTQSSLQATPAQPYKYEEIANGGIDIQALLDNITANAENNTAATSLTPTIPSATPSHASLPYGGSSLPSHASLPPRPQVSSYRPTPLVAAGAPGTSSDPRNGLPPPPTASFRPPALPTPAQSQQGLFQGHPAVASIGSPTTSEDADRKWTPRIQKIYDDFLEQERQYVAEGLWDRFPMGSRLFIGNLSSENVTKRDIFHVFHRYGRLAQVSIKQAYGFVQFHDSAACHTALTSEQGREIRGKKIHLEISKPQKNTRNAQKTVTQPVRRSRSPEYQRGAMAERGGRSNNSGGRGVDHYDKRPAQPGRDEYGRTLRARDDYRPGRSPSPPRGSYRGRDDYGSSRGRDYYDGRRRSRSNSPYGHRDNGRYRERSLSPGARQAAEDADLQIPRRNPRDVPDVQIILLDELDRGFVGWVDGELRGRGLKTEIMFLSPRLPVQAVIRRQILEGVHAVSQLDIRCQNSSKISLQVFDRQAGANNVRFDEYQDLEPRIAAELVLRAKQTQVQIPTYAQPTFPSAQSYQPPPAPAPAPAPATQDLVSLVGQLDNSTLQKLLSALPKQQENAPAAAANSAIDLAGLLGGLKGQPPQPVYQPPVPAVDPYNPGLTPFASSPQPQSAQQVQNIMAQLAKYRQ